MVAPFSSVTKYINVYNRLKTLFKIVAAGFEEKNVEIWSCLCCKMTFRLVKTQPGYNSSEIYTVPCHQDIYDCRSHYDKL